MRTSLNEAAELENWLLGKGDCSKRLVTEAKVIADPNLREIAEWQYRTYKLVRVYGREKLREQIEAIEHRMFTTNKFLSFQNLISSIFKQ